MAQVPQISSVKAPDKAVADATRPRRFKYLNLPFIIVTALLVCFGLVVVWSACYENDNFNSMRQVQGVALGAVLMLVIWRFDYRNLSDFMVVLLVINIVLILSPNLPFIGDEVNGARSWIKLFGQSAQPGELAKFTVVLLAASVVSRYGGKLDDPREYLKTLGILLVPFVCIMTQPDLGTGLVYLFIGAVALVMGGARPKYLLLTLAAGVVALAAIFAIDQIIYNSTGEYKIVKQYQRSRLLVFMETENATSDEAHQLQQGMIAIGSGGLFGKGLLHATQSTFGFLPEAPTDFIFCVLAEELGFFGVMVLLVLYVALLLICFRIAASAGDMFGTLIVMCCVGMWLFHILENIGMTLGLMPITGIPLPFMSYGSSFMIANFMLLGLIGSVWAHNGR